MASPHKDDLLTVLNALFAYYTIFYYDVEKQNTGWFWPHFQHYFKLFARFISSSTQLCELLMLKYPLLPAVSRVDILLNQTLF